MTSIEWLKQEYKVSGILTDLDFEQAKEMHKQEIIKSRENGIIEGIKRTNNNYYSSILESEQYYQETFVSKGNDTLKDYHIVDTNEMIELPQQEISDEEIEKWAKEYTCKEYEKLIFDYENYDEYRDFINGAKWYREQLKSKH
jgi:hypothetical protein